MQSHRLSSSIYGRLLMGLPEPICSPSVISWGESFSEARKTGRVLFTEEEGPRKEKSRPTRRGLLGYALVLPLKSGVKYMPTSCSVPDRESMDGCAWLSGVSDGTE